MIIDEEKEDGLYNFFFHNCPKKEAYMVNYTVSLTREILNQVWYYVPIQDFGSNILVMVIFVESLRTTIYNYLTELNLNTMYCTFISVCWYFDKYRMVV